MAETFCSLYLSRSELVPANVKAIICSLLIAVVVPPYTFYSRRGTFKNWEFWLCVILTILGYVPGVIYAVYIIYKEDISEGGRDVIVRTGSDNEDSTTDTAT